MDLVHPNLRCDRGARAGLRSARPTLLSVRLPSAFDIPEPIETPDLLDHGLIDRPEVQVSYRKGKLHASETWSAPAGTPHDRRIQFIERVLVGTNSASTRVIRQYWNAKHRKCWRGRRQKRRYLRHGAVRASWQKSSGFGRFSGAYLNVETSRRPEEATVGQPQSCARPLGEPPLPPGEPRTP